MELGFHSHSCCDLFANLVGDGQNGGFSCRDGLLGSTDCNVGRCARVVSLVDINLGTCLVLDLIDRGSTFSKDTSDGAGGHSEFDNVVGLLLELDGFQEFGFGTSNTFLASFNQNFIRFELFPSLAFTILSRMTREGDFDRVLFFKSNGILATLTDEGRVVLARNLEYFRCFVGLITGLSDVTK